MLENLPDLHSWAWQILISWGGWWGGGSVSENIEEFVAVCKIMILVIPSRYLRLVDRRTWAWAKKALVLGGWKSKSLRGSPELCSVLRRGPSLKGAELTDHGL